MLPTRCKRRCNLVKVYSLLVTLTLLWLILKGAFSEDYEQVESYRQRLPSENAGYVVRQETGPHQQKVPVRAETAEIHIFSVIAMNSSISSIWDRFAVNTWLDLIYVNLTINCCIRYRNRTTVRRPVLALHQKTSLYNLTAQLECANPAQGNTSHIYGLTVTTKDCCPADEGVYVRPEYPWKHEGGFSMAVCAKIAFGRLNPQLTIEWMEFYRLMGVSRVLAFEYKLSKAARAVLRYYERIGFLELRSFDFPADCPLRWVGMLTFDTWNDEQVTVFDCQARLSGYDYVAVVDFDEFIVPRTDPNFRIMLGGILDRAPTTGVLEFTDQIFVLDWGPSAPGELLISRYTSSMFRPQDRTRKAIHIPGRTLPGSAVTHEARAKQGFTVLRDPREFSLHHYRGCKYEWRKCSDVERHDSPLILPYANKIVGKVRDARTKILNDCRFCSIGL